jgi:hypothetical protein
MGFSDQKDRIVENPIFPRGIVFVADWEEEENGGL